MSTSSLLGELIKRLAELRHEVEGASTSQLSQLQTSSQLWGLALRLLESAAREKMAQGKGRTVATILKLIEHLLETSPAGLTVSRMEGTALIGALRFLTATVEDRRDSMDLVVTLALRFLSMAGSLSAKLVRDLYQGVCLLLLGIEEQLLSFSRPLADHDGSIQQQPAGKCIPAFQTLYARYLSVYGQQLQQQQHNDVLIANLSSPSACMALGLAMCKLLCALTWLYPLAVAPCTPPSLAAALTQLVGSTDSELQAEAMLALAGLVTIVGPPSISPEGCLELGMWALSAHMQGLLASDQSLKAASAWPSGLEALVTACIRAMSGSGGTLPQYAPALARLLAAAATHTSPGTSHSAPAQGAYGSGSGAALQASCIRMVTELLAACPSAAPHALPLLNLLPAVGSALPSCMGSDAGMKPSSVDLKNSKPGAKASPAGHPSGKPPATGSTSSSVENTELRDAFLPFIARVGSMLSPAITGCIVAEAAIQSPPLVDILLDLQLHAASMLEEEGDSGRAKASQAVVGAGRQVAGNEDDDDDEVVILEERTAGAAGSQGGDEAGPARKRRRTQPKSLRQTQLTFSPDATTQAGKAGKPGRAEGGDKGPEAVKDAAATQAARDAEQRAVQIAALVSLAHARLSAMPDAAAAARTVLGALHRLRPGTGTPEAARGAAALRALHAAPVAASSTAGASASVAACVQAVTLLLRTLSRTCSPPLLAVLLSLAASWLHSPPGHLGRNKGHVNCSLAAPGSSTSAAHPSTFLAATTGTTSQAQPAGRSTQRGQPASDAQQPQPRCCPVCIAQLELANTVSSVLLCRWATTCDADGKGGLFSAGSGSHTTPAQASGVAGAGAGTGTGTGQQQQQQQGPKGWQGLLHSLLMGCGEVAARAVATLQALQAQLPASLVDPAGAKAEQDGDGDGNPPEVSGTQRRKGLLHVLGIGAGRGGTAGSNSSAGKDGAKDDPAAAAQAERKTAAAREAQALFADTCALAALLGCVRTGHALLQSIINGGTPAALLASSCAVAGQIPGQPLLRQLLELYVQLPAGETPESNGAAVPQAGPSTNAHGQNKASGNTAGNADVWQARQGMAAHLASLLTAEGAHLLCSNPGDVRALLHLALSAQKQLAPKNASGTGSAQGTAGSTQQGCRDAHLHLAVAQVFRGVVASCQAGMSTNRGAAAGCRLRLAAHVLGCSVGLLNHGTQLPTFVTGSPDESLANVEPGSGHRASRSPPEQQLCFCDPQPPLPCCPSASAVFVPEGPTQPGASAAAASDGAMSSEMVRQRQLAAQQWPRLPDLESLLEWLLQLPPHNTDPQSSAHASSSTPSDTGSVDVNSAATALLEVSQCVTLQALTAYIVWAPIPAIEGGKRLLQRALYPLRATSACVRESAAQMVHAYLRGPVLFETFGAEGSPGAEAGAALDGPAAVALLTQSNGTSAGPGRTAGGPQQLHTALAAPQSAPETPVATKRCWPAPVLSAEQLGVHLPKHRAPLTPALAQQLVGGSMTEGLKLHDTLLELEKMLSGEVKRLTMTATLQAQPEAGGSAGLKSWGHDVWVTGLRTSGSLVGLMYTPLTRATPLFMLIQSLGQEQVQVRAAACEALCATSTRLGVPLAELALCPSAYGKDLLKFLGIKMAEAPQILPELARILGLQDTELARLVIPRVIGWICVEQKYEVLQRLADILDTTPAKLYVDYADWAIASLLWCDRLKITQVVSFVDSLLVETGEDFIHILKEEVIPITQKIVWMAGHIDTWNNKEFASPPAPSAPGSNAPGKARNSQRTDVPPAGVVSHARFCLEEFVAKAVTRDGAAPVHVTAAKMLSAEIMSKFQAQMSEYFNSDGAMNAAGAARVGGGAEPLGAQARRGGRGGVDGDTWHLYCKDKQPWQLQSLRALCVAMRLLEKSIGDYMPQINVVLTAALKQGTSPAVMSMALSAWRVFISCLAHYAPSSLARMITQVTVIMLPILENASSQGTHRALAISILEDLILTYREHTKAALKSLPPLPAAVPGLERVRAVIAKEQGGGTSATRQVRLLIHALKHESLEVRHSALNELHNLLSTNPGWVADLTASALDLVGGRDEGGPTQTMSGVTNTTTAGGSGKGTLPSGNAGSQPASKGRPSAKARKEDAALLGSLLAALLRSCENVNRSTIGNAMWDKCGECLGLLGALDPARVDPGVPPPEPLVDPGPGGLAFAKAAVTKHLVRMLINCPSNVSWFNKTALAIQSIVQRYSGSPSGGATAPGNQGKPPKGPASKSSTAPSGTDGDPQASTNLMAQLPPDVQAFVRPFLHSRYSLMADNTAATAAGSAAAGQENEPPGRAEAGAAAAQGGGVGQPPAGGGLPRSASGNTLLPSAAAGNAAGGAPGLGAGASTGSSAPVGRLLGAPTTIILGTPKPSSFRRWLELWLARMVGHATGPVQPAFQALSYCIKQDTPLMLFMLPQVVHNVITSGSPAAVASMKAEISALLSVACASPSPSAAAAAPAPPSASAPPAFGKSSRQPSLGVGADASLPLQGSSSLPMTGSTGVTAAPGAVPELELCLQALFTLVDTLSQWLKDAAIQEANAAAARSSSGGQSGSRSSGGAAATSGGSDVEEGGAAGGGTPSPLAVAIQKVTTFLDAIPKQQLAMAATRCGAHARALQYYETWVRGVHQGGLNPAAYHTNIEYTSAQVSFLLEVYGQLEEPDGVAGLLQLRQGGLTPADQLLVAEKAGNWGEATALYEQLLPREAPALQQGAAAALAAHSSAVGRGSSLPPTQLLGGTALSSVFAAAPGSSRAVLSTKRTSDGAATRPTVATHGCAAHAGDARDGAEGVAAVMASCSVTPSGLSSLRQGSLRALLQMGHLQALLQQADGLLCRLGRLEAVGAPGAAAARAQVAAAGVSAAWRMGHWGLLKEYLALVRHQGLGGAGLPDVHDPSTGAPGTPGSSAHLSQQDEWEVTVGSLLAALHSGDDEDVERRVMAARQDIVRKLPALSQESYTRAYPQLTKLAMLQELKDVHDLRRQASSSGHPLPGLQSLRQTLRWPQRLEAAQASLAAREPLLSLRRQLAGLLGSTAEAGVACLQYARLCRSMGHHEAAATAVLEAQASGVPGAALERAKLLWHSGRERNALEALRNAMKRPAAQSVGASRAASLASDGGPHAGVEQARLALQLAKWSAAQGQMGYADCRQLFESALSLEPKWEKAHFQFARYLDSMYVDAKKRQAPSGTSGGSSGVPKAPDRLNGRSKIRLGEERSYAEILPEVLHHYGKSVECGYRHALQCLPRMITLYCEFGNEQTAIRAKGMSMGSKARTAATQVINSMKSFAHTVAPVAWLVTLPQLISRVSHTNADVTSVINAVLVRCLDAYPQQTLWAMACLFKSTRHRMRVAEDITGQARKLSPSLTPLIESFKNVYNFLILLCNFVPQEKKRSRQMSATTLGPQILGLLEKLPACGVMVPIQDAFQVPLPPVPVPTSTTGANKGQHQHQAATTGVLGGGADYSAPVTITGMHDEILIMASLQRPKKIVLTGSDGRDYPFLAKPKDDLRKDYRLMDFATAANSLFAASAASRRRGLRLRTYYVAVLTEDCGILQWVNNLIPIKVATEDVYMADGLWKRLDSTNTIRRIYETWTEPSRAKLLDQVLHMFPPCLHKWWLGQFPEPAAWLQARLNFTRTNAVWCMTGHILGLGDRHGENIMIDMVSGDTLHVDFGCLFDRGLTLEVPEMVPFRLTQNVIDSFGVSGIEGTYRKSAETTLQVLRQHRATLMTCAETFLADPLVDWSKGSRGSSANPASSAPAEAGESENPMAKDALATIDGRLCGTLLGVYSQPSLPLSVEGHAARLIAEAVDKENLGKMYIWWMAWM